LNRNDLPDPFDFAGWAELAAADSDAFERARASAVQCIIDSSPPEMRQRLRGLQWRIDQVRRQSNGPVGACVKLSQMMWETLLGPDGLVEHIERLTEPGGRALRPPAAVLPFREAKGAPRTPAPDSHPPDGLPSPPDPPADPDPRPPGRN